MPTTLLIIAVTLNAVLGQLMLKYAVTGLGGAPALSDLPTFILSAAKSPLVYISIAIQGFGYLLWMMLIARMKLVRKRECRRRVLCLHGPCRLGRLRRIAQPPAVARTRSHNSWGKLHRPRVN